MPLFHTGPRGVCDDCGSPLDLRLGSLASKVLIKHWSASPELVSAIYQDLRKAARLDVPVMSVRCRTCRTLDPSRLIWVALGGEVGAAPQEGLHGPYCDRCFGGAVNSLYESSEGVTADLPLYYVRISPTVLERIKGTPRKKHAPPQQEEVEDLF